MKEAASVGDSSDAEFEHFYLETFPRIASFASRLATDREEAFDLTQEALVRTWVHWDTARELEEPAFYTMKIVANEAFSQARRLRRLTRALPRLIPHASHSDHDIADTRMVVTPAVRSLPRKERLAIVLTYLGDLSADDVAALMDIAPSTVRVHLHHARSRLKTLLPDPDGVE